MLVKSKIENVNLESVHFEIVQKLSRVFGVCCDV